MSLISSQDKEIVDELQRLLKARKSWDRSKNPGAIGLAMFLEEYGTTLLRLARLGLAAERGDGKQERTEG